MNHLDNAFINRATRLTSFNLKSSDFTSITYKLEIQTLYHQHMFPSFDPSMALDSITAAEYNGLVGRLKSDSALQYRKLHNLKMSGIGPGEIVMYLLTKKGYLRGGSGPGVDLYDGPNNSYEIKAAKWKSKTTDRNSVFDFKLGGNLSGMSDIVVSLQTLANELDLTGIRGVSSIPESMMKKMKEKDKSSYGSIESRYQELALKYFSGHNTIFLQTERNQQDFGEILAIKKVEAKDITMERYTSNVIKPIVKIR